LLFPTTSRYICDRMDDPQDKSRQSTTAVLAAQGYWPAQAAQFLIEGRFSRAVELCKEHLYQQPSLISGRLVYAQALYLAGQLQSAAEEFYQVLALDTDNVVALKGLGDIRFDEGDEITAFAHYQRVIEIDPLCCGLRSSVRSHRKETTRTITIARPGESLTQRKTALRDIYFYTETVGDLYLAQGHHRLAAEVFRTLAERSQNPRLREKLSKAEQTVKEKGR
jgi:tetratricopeptide (TPR) repeat protein